MGQFSWLYADMGNDRKYAMLDDVKRNSFLLVPPPFQSKYGKYIKETCYDGYGNMGGYDIYNLIVEWNRDYIPFIIEKRNGKMDSGENMDNENLMRYYRGEDITCELRWLGICLACYDEDNASLPFPIKITLSNVYDYNSMPPSESDPNQGWGCDEYDDDYDWDSDDDDEDEDEEDED